MPPTRTRSSTLPKTENTTRKRHKRKGGPVAIPVNDEPKDLALCRMVYPIDAVARKAFRTRDGKKLTAHQWAVYDLTRTIPRGRVTTYGALCKALGSGSARSVGNALRCNPFAPYVPCHRVIASSLYIGGFFGEWGTLGAASVTQDRVVEKEVETISGEKGGDQEIGDAGRQCQKKVEMLAMEGVGFTRDGYLADESLIWRG